MFEIPARPRYCSHGDAVLSCVFTSNGSRNILMWCRACTTNVSKHKGFAGIWIQKDHPAIAHIDLSTLPVAYTLQEWRQCEGECKRIATCQLHHWAPRVHFGDDADKWPTSWLCDRCHRDEWHAKVTPGLCTTFDPALYAAFLISAIGMDRAARLAQQLIRQGREARHREEASIEVSQHQESKEAPALQRSSATLDKTPCGSAR